LAIARKKNVVAVVQNGDTTLRQQLLAALLDVPVRELNDSPPLGSLTLRFEIPAPVNSEATRFPILELGVIADVPPGFRSYQGSLAPLVIQAPGRGAILTPVARSPDAPPQLAGDWEKTHRPFHSALGDGFFVDGKAGAFLLRAYVVPFCDRVASILMVTKSSSTGGRDELDGWAHALSPMPIPATGCRSLRK
jgi:hypothetical protein